MVLSQTLGSDGLTPSLLVFQEFGFSMELKRERKAPVQSLHICTRKGIILSVSAKLGVLPVVGLQAVLCQVGFGYRRSSYQLPEVLEPSHRGHKLLRSHCCITPHEQVFVVVTNQKILVFLRMCNPLPYPLSSCPTPV